MNRLAAFAALPLTVLMATPSMADITTKQFIQLYFSPDGQDLGALRIGAMEQGIHAVNATLVEAQPPAPLYCQPDALVMTASQLADMVKRAVDKDSKIEEQPLATTLLGVLRATFPCAAPGK